MEKTSLRNGFLIALVAGLFIGISYLIPDGSPDLDAPATVEASPIEEKLLAELRPPPGALTMNGTAIAILVDTSGSMKSSVRDLDGVLRPKIDIAKRATRRLLDRLKQFLTRSPS